MHSAAETTNSLITLLVAALASGGVGLAYGRTLVNFLGRRYRERVKSISPTVARLHQQKNNTPTLGGTMIVLAVVLGSAVAIAQPTPSTLIAIATLVLFALLGAVDDLVKLRTERRGLSMRAKLAGQFGLASLLVPLALLAGDSPEPVVGGWGLTMGPVSGAAVSILGGMLLIVASANAVNLTDGLDGLAAGCGAFTCVALAAAMLLASQTQLATLTVALAAALAAFLWFNRHPAQVFMGDTGSQATGALLGYLAWASGCPWYFALVAAVFVIEVVSVIAQLASYRLRGKRLLRCAPLHHHFQFGGVAETTIVRRFWLVAASSAVAGFIGLTMVGSNEVAPARSAKTPAATVRAVASTFQKLNL